MTDQEINIRIAEACGHDFSLCPVHLSRSCCGRTGYLDYCNDRNAMAEVESAMTGDEWRIFLGFLKVSRTIPKFMSMDEFLECWKSKPRQRAEAFLRTKGLWREAIVDKGMK